MIDKATWESGVIIATPDPATGEHLRYVPEHVYDRVVGKLQDKLRDHVTLLEETYELLDEGSFSAAFTHLDEARTRGL